MRKAYLIALVAGLAAGAHAQNLLSNPGFESGALSPWTESDATDGLGLFIGPVQSYFDLQPHSGSWFILDGAFGEGSDGDGALDIMSQSVGTTAGKHYTFSFWAATDDTVGDNGIAAFVNGVDVSGQMTVPAIPDNGFYDYTQYSFDVLATGATTTVGIGMRCPPAFIAVDDASFTENAVPEPASFAILGLGALALIRRRKQA